jgi:hypothetical protein
LLVADVLHPIDDFTVEFFLDGDVGHGRGRARAVPVLLPRRKPNDITRMNVKSLTLLETDPILLGSKNG